jgi:antitoxin HicB
MNVTLQYTINLRPEPEGGYTVLVPALPEVVTYGETEEEALRMAHEAIEVALEVRRDEVTKSRPMSCHLSAP